MHWRECNNYIKLKVAAAASLALMLVGCGEESGLNLGGTLLVPDVLPISLTTLDSGGTTFITPETNEAFTIVVGVANQGGANAKSFKVRVEVGPADEPATTAAVFDLPTGLSAGATTTVQMPFTTSLPGEYDVRVVVDSEGVLATEFGHIPDLRLNNDTANDPASLIWHFFVSGSDDGGGDGPGGPGIPVPIIANS